MIGENVHVIGENVHPADELAYVRWEIRRLKEREDQLRTALLDPGADRNGKRHVADVITSTRETLDREQLTAEFGRTAVERFIVRSSVTSIRLRLTFEQTEAPPDGGP